VGKKVDSEDSVGAKVVGRKVVGKKVDSEDSVVGK